MTMIIAVSAPKLVWLLYLIEELSENSPSIFLFVYLMWFYLFHTLPGDKSKHQPGLQNL